MLKVNDSKKSAVFPQTENFKTDLNNELKG